MKIFKKFNVFFALAMIVSLFSITGCTNDADTNNSSNTSVESAETGGGGNKVGIAMPTQSLQRWNQDGNNLKDMLEKEGFEVDLQYAQNEPETQVSMIENMIAKGANYLIIAPIDGETLSAVVNQAKQDGVKTIAYDRLIMNTDGVDYYSTFDNTKVGEIQGQYIVDSLKLDESDESYNLELATGPMDDNNTRFYFDGAMSVLQPYIDEGKLVIKSGQTEMNQAATPNWDEAEAQARMENILTSTYQDENVDAILCSNDSVSLGVQSALKAAGYGKGDKEMPITTGQDANIPNVKAILDGTQSMSVFKDTRELAKKTVNMILSMENGEEVEVNDTETYDNGVKVVPSYLIEPIAVDQENIDSVLFESGYYDKEEFK